MMLSSQKITAVIITTVAGLAVTYLLAWPLAIGFSASFLLLVILMLQQGLSIREAMATAVTGALHTKEVVYILLFVGLLIPAWTASGTIAYMIGLGMDWVTPAYFLTSAFLLSTVISLLLGTSTGTLSAVGIPIIGMALQLDISLAITAGALVSGAFVGDRGSPFSSAFQLVADSTGTERRQLGRAMLPTSVGAGVISLLFFALADRYGDWASRSENDSYATYEAISYAASGWLLIPPLLLIGTMVMRLGSRLAFILAIASSIVIGTVIQDIPVSDWPPFLWYGFTEELSGGPSVKGVSQMIELIVLIAVAGAFNGLLEKSRTIEPLVRKSFASVSSLTGATWRTALYGLLLGLVTCTQTLPIMMTGRHLRDTWAEQFNRIHLGRVVADTSLIFAAMVPWNMLAILCSAIIGVSVLDYVPYAAYLWAIPVLTLIYSRFYNKR